MAEDRRRHIEEYYLTAWKFVTKKKVEKCIYIMTVLELALEISGGGGSTLPFWRRIGAGTLKSII